MDNLVLQHNLFKIIKTKLSKETNLAKDLAEKLNVSIDAAYKKIKSERILDLAELQLLLHAYKIPISDLDTINHYNKVWFNFKPIDGVEFTYKDYLRQMVNNLKMLIANNVQYIIYSAREVPLFYNFMFAELGYFKSIVWQNSILNIQTTETEKFSVNQLDIEIVELGFEIYELYNKIWSKEIWNYETVKCTIKQIDFYKIANKFLDEESYEVVTNQYKMLINHVEKQTAIGHKINFKTNEAGAKFDLYHNEIIVGDNSVLIQFEFSQMAFITPNAVNSFTTSQKQVTDYLSHNFDSILQKSIRLNKQNEKIRTPFFEDLKKHLH